MISPLAAIFMMAPWAWNAPDEGTRFGCSVLALGDLDGDGVPEIAVGAPAAGLRGLVVVLSGATRDLLQVWRSETSLASFGHVLLSAGDANADGVDDVLVGFERFTRTEVRSGVDGTLIRGYWCTWRDVVPLGDVDEDGATDLLVMTEHDWTVRSGRTDEVLLKIAGEDGRSRFVPVGDLDADGLVDGVVLGAEAELLLSSRKASAPLSWSEQLSPRLVRDHWREILQPMRFDIGHAAPAGDLDGDGVSDLLLDGYSGETRVLLGLSLRHRAKVIVRLDGRAPVLPGDRGIEQSIPLASGLDIDNDGKDDLVLGCPISVSEIGVLAVPGSTTNLLQHASWSRCDGALWSTTWGAGGAISSVSLAPFDDVDDDGIRDVLVGSSDCFFHGAVTANGTLRLLSGRTGKTIWSVGEERYDELRPSR